jgi:hypothetical protein
VFFGWVAAWGQVVINEICPANADINYDPQYYNYTGWVELYNAGSSNVNIGGYYLSDDITVKNKWRIPGGTTVPAKGFLLIWCDDMNNGLHTSFSMDTDGEDLVLSNGGGSVVDQVVFPEQYTNISYGRLSDGGANWGYMKVATPRAANNPATATQVLPTPEFSVKPGRYSSARTVTITCSEPGAEIRFTTDGTEPGATATLYSAPVAVNATRTLKAKAFSATRLPGKTATATYFISEHAFSLPVVSISTRPAYLTDNTIGIYVIGSNGVAGNCNDNKVNWNQDWDRHAVFEYFDENGNRVLEEGVDIRIGGACSRNQAQKSLVIKARDKYGKKTIAYKFFETKESDSYGGLMLRNAGNDFNTAMFRDAFLQSLVIGQMDVDYMAYQPAIVYLNGQYWGIQNLREKIDADFIESNYGIEKEDLDLLETWENALEGTSDAYLAYKNTLQAMDRTTPEAFAFIDQHIDVQEFINYLVAEIYYANTDWPGNNMKFWRQRSTNGKFRWILWDTDFGFGLYQNQSYATHPTLDFATDPDNNDWPNPSWSTLHIRMVLENPQFRSRFIQTLNTAMNTTFAPDRVISMIDAFAARIAAEVPHHKARWWGSVGDWQWEVQRLRDFAVQRNVYMRQHAAEFFGLSESVNFSITSSPAETGTYRLNGIVADKPLLAGSYFRGLPYAVEPVPAPGYKFKSWRIKKRETEDVPLIEVGSEWKYSDQGTLPGATWTSTGFNDGAWSSGQAELGYGDGDEATVVGFGGNASNKFITTYFRKSFVVEDTTNLSDLSASVLMDDGVVIYLNGIEVFRHNMPSGAITNATLALQALPSETAFVPFTIPKGMVRPGTNVLAVELHQNGVTSTDISFNFAMRTVRVGDESESTTTEPLISDVAHTDIIIEATFEPDDRVISGVVINEINTRPGTILDGSGEAGDWFELYNTSDKTVNLAGLYLSDNGSQKTKHRILPGTGDEMVLDPGAYKIFWADEALGKGADHVAFKLSADGEKVILSQVLDDIVSVIDEHSFGAQLFPGSFSRIPNGSGPFEFTAMPTPGTMNELVTGTEAPLSFQAYPNPVTTHLYLNTLARIREAHLTDSYGRVVRSFQDVQHGEALPMESVVPGLYLLRVLHGGHWQVLKIVKQ